MGDAFPLPMETSPVPAPALDLSHHFSNHAKKRQRSQVKKLYKYFLIPGMRNLAGGIFEFTPPMHCPRRITNPFLGLPHVTNFPFDTLEAAVALPNRFKPTPLVPVDPPASEDARDAKPSPIASAAIPSSAHLKVPKESSTTNLLKKIDLATALQYGTASGYPPLHEFVREFVRQHLHPNVPYAPGPDVILTNGATDGFTKTLDVLSNIWTDGRDWIATREGLLCEEFTYMNAIQATRPRGLNIVTVATDAYGMCATGPKGLREVLENWDFSRGRRPHLMYTVT
jgi:DNA-binding transcriptional MocR family regulator